jgi:uracil-DNA glycosylase family 4
MVIGKMPVDAEIKSTFNLTGPAGALIREVAQEIGYPQINDWYVTNAIRFTPSFMRKSDLPKKYVNYCWPLLLHEIALIKPKMIVLMGADAVKALAGKTATLQMMRSSVMLMRGLEGVREPMSNLATIEEQPPGTIMVCATIHPAAVLRENGMRQGFKADMIRIRDLHAGKGIAKLDYSDRNYVYVEKYQDLKEVTDKLLAENKDLPLAVDCETGGADFRTGVVRSIQFSWAAKTACVVSLLKRGGWPIQDEAERVKIINELHRLFTDPRAKLIFHNGRYELKWLGHIGLNVEDNFYFDTMLADHCLNENAEHGLESLSTRFTDMGRYDWPLFDWIKSNDATSTLKERGYLDIPDDILLPYSACDTDCTFRCYEVLHAMLERPQNIQPKKLFETVIMPCNYPLHEIERTGTLVDRGRLVEMTHRFHERKEKLVEMIGLTVGIDHFNPRSNPQKIDLLFNNLGLKPYKTTGKPSRMWNDLKPEEIHRYTPAVDLETLEALTTDDKHKRAVIQLLHDFAVVDQVCKQFLTLEGDVVGGLVDYISSDGRIHTSLSQTSETGREKSSNPNLQNLPKSQESELKRILGADLPSIRSAFVAPPGHVIVEADYKSAEIFTLGYLSGCEQLVKDAYSDLHARGAVNYFGAPKWKGFDEGKKPPGDWKKEHSSIRVAAKTINFGIAYQRGAKAVARAITAETDGKIAPSPDDAQRFIDGFYDTYPEVRAYVDYCKNCVVEPGYVSNAYGRRRRFMAKPDEERGQLAAWEREAVNMPIQGTVADALNVALANMYQWRKLFSGRCDYRIVLAVHDATLIEVSGEQAHIVYDEVLPTCMTRMTIVPSWEPWPHTHKRSEPFVLDIDREVCIRWGMPASADELIAAGVRPEHAKRMVEH